MFCEDPVQHILELPVPSETTTLHRVTQLLLVLFSCDNKVISEKIKPGEIINPWIQSSSDDFNNVMKKYFAGWQTTSCKLNRLFILIFSGSRFSNRRNFAVFPFFFFFCNS